MTAEGPLRLTDDEAVAIFEVATAFAGVLPGERRGPYADLAREASTGSIPPERFRDLERVCELALQTGRARQLGRAETERLVGTVYRRTPAGRALATEASDVSRVLDGLTGRTLQVARVSARMPGRYQLDLVVDGVDVAISLEPEGLEVRSLQTG